MSLFSNVNITHFTENYLQNLFFDYSYIYYEYEFTYIVHEFSRPLECGLLIIVEG